MLACCGSTVPTGAERTLDGVEVSITRDYGATADLAAKKLITKRAFATGSVLVSVWMAAGRSHGRSSRTTGSGAGRICGPP